MARGWRVTLVEGSAKRGTTEDLRPDLLFLCHRIPYPPNKGDKIRSFRWWAALVEHFRVHLGAFVDDPLDWTHARYLQQDCRSSRFLPLPRTKATLRSLSGFLTGTSLTLPYYRDIGMQRWVDERLARYPIRHLLVFSSAMAQYVNDERWSSARRVIDFVDVDSDKWRQYGNTKSWPASWIYRREARRLQEEEKRLARTFDASVLVSDQEASLFRSQVADVAHRVVSIGNGVDITFFSFDPERSSPYTLSSEPVVFTGAMDYWANADAVIWFAREIWPKVLEKRPRAVFFVVGARPTPNVVALGCSNIRVTGWVRDVRPYLQCARVVVAPMRIARGVQNKVLEGMAMGKAVITTSRGLEGIGAVPGRDLLVCDEPDAYASAVLALMDGAGSEIGASGRRFVAEYCSWSDSARRPIELLLADDRVQIMS